MHMRPSLFKDDRRRLIQVLGNNGVLVLVSSPNLNAGVGE